MGTEIGLGGIAVLLVLILLRVPIGISLITVSFGGIWMLLGPRPAWGILTAIPYDFASSWALTSVPMFLLMGFFCYQAGLTTGLFDAARKWLSVLPGGLAIASIFGSAGFAAVTGSSVACAAAMGKIAVPEMMRYGYDSRLATGTVAAAGTIGALIPPSIIMIIYGIFAQVPITELFLGGIAAGLLTAVGYVVVVVTVALLKPEMAPPVEERVSLEERIRALGEVWPVLLLIAGVFGGLFSGIFTPTEAGAAGALLSMIIATFKRTLTWRAFRDALRETAQTTAAIFVIAIGASLLTRFLTLSGASKFLSAYVISLGADPLMLMLGIALMYLVLGMFLEPIGAMLLTIPILLPVMDSTGLSLVWFGVVLTKFLEIGMITPPVGLNVFVIKGVVGELTTTTRIFQGVLWFLLADLVVVAMLMAFPEIVLYLPSLIE
ncbi:TRAP transporter large permease [Minwuia thermotolerans]|uniref:TRAP transporter large permease protein n=1 Tax=Minwuia thermotolerans TaxID=2056226 RepID=A0A2M9G3P7_9PROT|nr:TRAP transporter large permease [Minwuia thermotolerans]PJK30331.1 C4-dicarboxylate ABC transporter [Minwuia thermotolerans]